MKNTYTYYNLVLPTKRDDVSIGGNLAFGSIVIGDGFTVWREAWYR